ncbi:MAG: hypothetical protein ACRCXT_01810 [Paraclostridium sp.]
MKIKRLITKINRYFDKDEAMTIYEILAKTDATYKLRPITKTAYAIEITKIENEEKAKLKEELKEIMATVYKTTDSWKELSERQEKRETKDHTKTDLEREVFA